MARLMLNDELWSKLRKIMLQQGIYDKPNLRLVVEAMLYRMRVGCPWRDLPASFGCWNSIYQQFSGEVHDCKIAPEFIEKLPNAEHTIADKGYDSDKVRDTIRKKSSIPVIPRKINSKTGNADMDWGLYKYRHLVENLFARIKHFRAVATRFDKLKRNYTSVVAMSCAFLWLPM